MTIPASGHSRRPVLFARLRATRGGAGLGVAEGSASIGKIGIEPDRFAKFEQSVVLAVKAEEQRQPQLKMRHHLVRADFQRLAKLPHRIGVPAIPAKQAGLPHQMSHRCGGQSEIPIAIFRFLTG